MPGPVSRRKTFLREIMTHKMACDLSTRPSKLDNLTITFSQLPNKEHTLLLTITV